jgi:hypothetical protein
VVCDIPLKFQEEMWAMKSFFAGFGAFAVWAVLTLPASAGWDNVFQPTLFERWRQPSSTSAYYVAPVVVEYQAAPVVVAQYQPPVVVAQASPCTTCQSPPQQQCSTSYVQRSFYQPVTVMQTQTVQEAVTTMRTSYYYEPVTSYRYSLYVDPCTGCAQQVATPSVAYQLKAQSSPVQTWVSRCVQVPVTVTQKVDYWQPQTTCCTTTQGAPIYTTPLPQSQQPPLIQAEPGTPQSNQAPSIRSEGAAPKGTLNQQYYPPLEKIPGNGASFQPSLGMPVPVPTSAPPAQPSPPIKFNQIAVNPNSVVEGQVVRSDNTPKGNAKVIFINASTGKRETITTNSGGRFQLELPAGSWHVYLYGADGLPVHHSRIDVNGAQSRQVSLVSRSN